MHALHACSAPSTLNFGQAKAVPYLAFGLAHVLDLMHAGKMEEAEGLMLLLMAAIEQSTLDGGRWQLALLLTHLPEPPWGQLRTALPPDQLMPFGVLTDPSWTAAAMAYLKDASALADLRKKHAGGKGDKPKGKGKDAEKE